MILLLRVIGNEVKAFKESRTDLFFNLYLSREGFSEYLAFLTHSHLNSPGPVVGPWNILKDQTAADGDKTKPLSFTFQEANYS